MLSSVEAILLSLVNEKPSHAYEVEKQLEARQMRRWVKIGVASVYQVLVRLEKAGLLTSAREKEGRMPERKRYHITEAGRRELAATARELLQRLEWYYLDLNVGLECSDLLPRQEVRELLARRWRLVRANIRHVEGSLAEVPPGYSKRGAVLRSLLAFRQAEERFLAEMLRQLAEEGAKMTE